jgi:transcriptional regulator with XRE-family HTH domain
MALNNKAARREVGGGLGGAIRSLRRRLNATQVGLSTDLGLAQSTLCQYEAGDARPSVEKLIALLRFASVDGERGPILEALEAYGVLTSDLAPSLVGLPENLPTIPVSGEALQIAMSGSEVQADNGGL